MQHDAGPRYGYDPVGRLNAMTRELAGTSADQGLGFAYNPASQIVTRTSSNDAFASNTAYNVSRPYSVNGLNQYTAAGPASFLYDANGNLKSDGSTTFVYDAENRLVSASGAKNASLAYDPLGRLWQTSGGAAGTTRFVYDGDRLVEEYDGNGYRPRVYVHGQGADEPLIQYEATGGPVHHFYHTDHQGSIVAMADDYGNPIAVNGYDTWGIPNAGNVGRFGYTGQAWIAELGMYYYKARIYSPTLGRFMQTDPVGYEDQVNLYAYAGNDPVNKADPNGTYACEKKDCAQVEAARLGIVRARDNLAQRTGTRLPSGASQHLSNVLRTVGTQGDRNGLTIRVGDSEKAYGDFDESTNTITLDARAIAENPLQSMSGVLAHEGSHAYDAQIGRAYERFDAEIRADAHKAMVEIGLGRPGLYYAPGRSGDEIIRRIKQDALRYCPGGGPVAVACKAKIDTIYPRVRAF